MADVACDDTFCPPSDAVWPQPIRVMNFTRGTRKYPTDLPFGSPDPPRNSEQLRWNEPLSLRENCNLRLGQVRGSGGVDNAYLPGHNESAPSLHDPNFPLSLSAPLSSSLRGSLGGADFFSFDSGHKKWPRTEDHLVLITYCYKNPATATLISDKFEDALNAWRAKLGDIPFDHGHVLLFEETSDGTSPIYCEGPLGSGQWNQRSLKARCDFGYYQLRYADSGYIGADANGRLVGCLVCITVERLQVIRRGNPSHSRILQSHS
ncbi:hypothetical protein BDV96DRAFT_601335 [Lophiotrema nucula]|uniref:Uncharacterized protein n=1 Tax=Lophiotrema nucula TaxID=690887 RepID=A0A6A5Z383_9PLEO|nr:hypothetical protein BDV96DRAFT_601335 [Lophiotrema nucula]